MLPFFRKIRFQLAKDNQFFKYSRYAMGEIVLVVVGILIALYINNWNEKRKQREKFDQVLFEVEKELRMNIENTRNVLDFYHYIDSLSNIFFFDSLTVEEFQKSRVLANLGSTYIPGKIEVDAYNKLTEYSEDISIRQDSAVVGLKRLYGIVKKGIDDMSQKTADYSQEIFEGHGEFAWYLDVEFDIFSQEALEHYFEDPIHRNKVSIYITYAIVNLVPALESFDISGRRIYRNIHKYLSNKYPDHTEPLFFKYDPNDYKFLTGTYIPIWSAHGGHEFLDSTVIRISNDTLLYIPYLKNGTNSRREIIPRNKSYFRTEFGRGFYQIVYDDNGDVLRVDHSSGLSWSHDEKIRESFSDLQR